MQKALKIKTNTGTSPPASACGLVCGIPESRVAFPEADNYLQCPFQVLTNWVDGSLRGKCKLIVIMKILILDTMYPKFLRSVGHYETPEITDTYDDVWQSLMATRFGVSDVYSHHLNLLGHQAHELVANSPKLQGLWAKENGLRLSGTFHDITPSIWSKVPLLSKVSHLVPTFQRLILKQIEAIRPDVLYVQDLNFSPPTLLREFKKHAKYVVGQIASPLPSRRILANFDMIFSSLPNFVNYFHLHGLKSAYLPIAFDARVRGQTKNEARDIGVSFVGGISPQHNSTIPLLSAIAPAVPELEIYGYGSEHLKSTPQLEELHKGEVWGLDMYRVLNRSNITINRHISIAENYANNMRLYEATGMGALLITDRKDNLGQIFEIDKEVLAYANTDEARDLTLWAIDNPSKAKIVAEAGQLRTMSTHTYSSTIAQLDEELQKLTRNR